MKVLGKQFFSDFLLTLNAKLGNGIHLMSRVSDRISEIKKAFFLYKYIHVCMYLHGEAHVD